LGLDRLEVIWSPKCRECACRVASASVAAKPETVVPGCVVGVGIA
jgi:hypothetical protein